MADEAEFLRRRLTLMSVQAERAQARATTLEVELKQREKQYVLGRAEILRLRALVEAQREEIEQLRRRAQEAEKAARQVALDTLIRSVRRAVAVGAEELDGHVVTDARAEIRAALGIHHGTQGLVVGAPGVYAEQALSTISFDIRGLPPDAAEEASIQAVGAVYDAVMALQLAVDRPLPPAAAGPARAVLAQASAFLAAQERRLALLPDRLAPLVASLLATAEQAPELAEAVEALVARHAAAAVAAAGADELARLGAALADVAAAVEGQEA